MKTFLFLVALAASSTHAFTGTTHSVLRSTDTALNAYVPDGMTPEQWKQMQAKEKATNAKKKFGAFGPQSFKSRSLQSFQKEMEKGKAGHLMPVFNAKEQIKAGKIKQEDVPYMQRGERWNDLVFLWRVLALRNLTLFSFFPFTTYSKIGGSWDNSDIKSATKVAWNKDDEKYNQSGRPGRLDWSGNNPRQSPVAKQKQAPAKPQTRKLFGMF